MMGILGEREGCRKVENGWEGGYARRAYVDYGCQTVGRTLVYFVSFGLRFLLSNCIDYVACFMERVVLFSSDYSELSHVASC